MLFLEQHPEFEMRQIYKMKQKLIQKNAFLENEKTKRELIYNDLVAKKNKQINILRLRNKPAQKARNKYLIDEALDDIENECKNYTKVFHQISKEIEKNKELIEYFDFEFIKANKKYIEKMESYRRLCPFFW